MSETDDTIKGIVVFLCSRCLNLPQDMFFTRQMTFSLHKSNKMLLKAIYIFFHWFCRLSSDVVLWNSTHRCNISICFSSAFKICWKYVNIGETVSWCSRVKESPVINIWKHTIKDLNRDVLTCPQIGNNKDAMRKTWNPKFTLRSHFDGIRALTFHPVEPVLITASEDHTLKMWNLQKTAPAKK